MASSTSSSSHTRPHSPSNVRLLRRYEVNVKLLVITITAIVVAGPICYAWYNHQIAKTTQTLLTRAKQLDESQQWASATGYYQRYLILNPADSDVLINLVESYAKIAQSPAQRAGLTRLLYRALGRAPDRTDLRLMLAQSLLETGAYAKARSEADKLITPESAEADDARVVVALAAFGDVRNRGTEVLAEAIDGLRVAAEQFPGDVRLATTTAVAVRENPAAVSSENLDAATIADRVMDRLVDAAPQDLNARLGRYRYRRQYRLDGAEEDLQVALELAPQHVDVLLLAAKSELANDGDDSRAEEFLRTAIESEPRDVRPYLVLSQLRTQMGHPEEALELLGRAQKLAGDDFHLALALVHHLDAAGEHAEAKRMLRRAQSTAETALASLEAPARIRLEHRMRVLQATLALGEPEPNLDAAAVELQPVALRGDAKPEYRNSPEWSVAVSMLAQIAEQRGQWDQAAAYWDALLAAQPHREDVVDAVARAYSRLGDAGATIKRIESYAIVATPTVDLQVQLLQAHLSLQLRRPAAKRNWSEFNRALEQSKLHATDRWEVVSAEVEYLLADARPENPGAQQQVLALLDAAERNFQGEAPFWRWVARIYQRMQREDDMTRAVARHRDVEPSSVNHAALQVILLSAAEKYAEAIEVLDGLLATLPQIDQLPIKRLRIEVLMASKDFEAALEQVAQFLADHPDDLKVLNLGIRLALDMGEFDDAERWEAALAKISTASFDYRFLRSLRLLTQPEELDGTQRARLGRTISEMRGERPRWYPVVALAARYAELDGELPQALADYRRAVDLGDQRPETLRKLVGLLYRFDRLGEVQAYLSQLSSDQPENRTVDLLAIQVAVKQNRLAEALELAQRGVKRHPDDPMRYIWLANLQLRQGNDNGAIESLNTAARKFPDDPQIWKGLLTLCINTGREAEARQTLRTLTETDEVAIESPHFLAAQGYEVLGDRAEAKRHYDIALKRIATNEPRKEVAVRLRYAQLLLSSNTAAAREQFEEVLKLESDNGDARRGLASLLAASGQDGDWARAEQLLAHQATDTPANAATNDRLRATLLSRQGGERDSWLKNCMAAEAILLRLIDSSRGQPTDIDRRLLAGVYEQVALLTGDESALLAAREQLSYLVNRPRPAPENLVLYIEFLMKHAREEANVAKDSTDADVENRPAAHDFRKLFLDDAESRLADLTRAQELSSSPLTDTLSSVDLTVRLLRARGRNDEAAEYVAQFVKNQNKQTQDRRSQAQLYFTTGNLYSTLEQYAEAERWYRRLMEIAPPAYVLVVRSLVDQEKRTEAAELYLSVAKGKPTPEEAVVLARILTVNDEVGDVPVEARAAIEAATAQYQDDVTLLQAAAVMKASHGEYDSAIAGFRRIIELAPNDTLAMNNLATLLAERPNQRGEALQYVERAIAIEGREAALLDTQGTILLKMGNHERAIACLEEATSGQTNDARYHFHLAVAYQLANRIDEAFEALQLSRDLGLEKTVLTKDDRTLLAQLDDLLSKTNSTQGGPPN